MKSWKCAAFLAAVLMSFTLITGCQSQAAQLVDQQILALVDGQVTLKDGETVQAIRASMDALSEKEYESLRNTADFDAFSAEYQALEDKRVAAIEAAISALPAPSEIRLASEDSIRKAASMYDGTTDLVRERVSNADVLQAARDGMERYKEKCWVSCDECDGDGKVRCKLCGGTGSREVNHTTPNGKTWRVHQDCKKTQSCGVCSGMGGSYIE